MGLAACSDPVEIPDVTNPDPVFTSTINIDGRDITLNAGQDNNHAVATFREVNEDFLFNTTFKSKDCDRDCPGSLTFVIGGAEPSTGAFDIERQIFPGKLSFFRPPAPSDSLLVMVLDRSDGFSLLKRWEVNGKELEPEKNKDTLIFTIPRAKNSEICLTSFDRMGNQAKQCQMFDPFMREVPRTVISVDDLGQVALSVKFIQPYDRARVVGKWNVNNNTDQRIILRDTEFFGREVCYESILSPNLRSRSCVKVGKSTREFEINSLFEIMGFKKLNVQPIRRGTVELIFIDEKGTRYTSSAPSAMGNGNFEIRSSDFFEDQGQKWLKVSTRFDAILTSSNGERLDLRGGEAVIPIAFPQ